MNATLEQPPLQLADDLESRFMRFHVDNPRVYERLVSMAREWLRAGRKHGGIKMFWEALRYESGIQTTDTAFKLNNSFPSRYARLIMRREPDLAGFFETRELHS